MIETGIEDVLKCIRDQLAMCWDKTGYGTVTIDSERIKDGHIRVIVRGTVNYRFVLRIRSESS